MSVLPAVNCIDGILGSIWFQDHPVLGVDLMTHLFNRLDGAYPNVFRANFKTAESVANWREAWAEAFEESGVTPSMLKTGIQICRMRHDMPPSLPQFLRACRPGLDDDPEKAFFAASEQAQRRYAHQPENWPTPRHFWAAQRIGGDITKLAYRDLKARWANAWEQAVADTDRPIPVAAPPESSLPAPGRTSIDAAGVKRIMAGAAQVLTRPKVGGAVDLSWATAINDDPARYHTAGCRSAYEVLVRYGQAVSAGLLAKLGVAHEVSA